VAGGNAGIIDWNLSSGIDVPKWKTNLSTNWSYGDHNVNASINYIGPVSLLRVYNADVTYPQPFCHYGSRKTTDAEQNRNTTVPLFEAYYPSCDIHSWTTVGVGYSYSGFKSLTLSLNIQNLLDTKAPYDPAVGVNTAATPLAGYNEGLHNNYGRYFTFSARYAF
jgi:iron complex outermembrane receptor protein